MVKVKLRPYTEQDIYLLWELAYQKDLEWRKWNGPYFNEPVMTFEHYQAVALENFVASEMMAVIEVDQEVVGQVFSYWDDGELKHWLEMGICLYDSTYWGKGIGTVCFKLWLNYLFNHFKYLPRIGFTTWSGNIGMMSVGEKLGMTKEGQMRQVRYYNGRYYDSIRYGILRDEWFGDSRA
ncbi:GNAT family N-acetyltransferase [Vagococcus silagei]|uniref:N-acetyltransferase n=1 Tax=Vagococcus silagei TaxID=2508885 RepID=A0A4S3B4K2_9ENTE|nr:GNAT family protein [Vagococcus silagei]THB60533.1 N-acetyltransferase [Vagococcus silagei]